ncbi:MAG TPA: nucleotidyl transferase AbiEii/AbiGii toxin family protein [Planctomycetota bacterium]|nr:nucleotidyl transferase AbiEii/AbiGii toxin family protein [Planctomycetota bacterium]
MAESGASATLAIAARRLIDALEEARIPYALGGALALGYHAPPRGTRDIDLNVFLLAQDSKPAFEVLRDAGVELDPTAAAKRAGDRGDAVGQVDGIRVDVFVNSIPLHEDASRRLIRVDFGGAPVWILSAEDLAFLKLMFNRPKDLLDVQQMCFTLGEDFDHAYLRRQLEAHLGDDHRLNTADKLRLAYG